MSTTRKALFTLAALGLVAFAAHPASAQTVITGTITGLFDTGVDANNVVLANGTVGDPHYTITSAPAGAVTQTLVRTSVGGYPIPPYNGDSSTSAWIGPDSTTGTNGDDLTGPVGTYAYTTTFDVTGLASGFVGSAVITGDWATDNDGTDILINGVSTGSKTAAANDEGFTGYTPFTINATNLVNGSNTLTFDVYNAPYNLADNPTALRVDNISATSVTGSAAPEPSQIGMLALAALGLGALVIKARKRSTAAQTA